MTSENNERPKLNAGDETTIGPPPRDELDGLLRTWHARSADQAREGRDRLLRSLAAARSAEPTSKPAPVSRRAASTPVREVLSFAGSLMGRRSGPWIRAAASLTLLVTLVALLIPLPNSRANAQTIFAAEAGRLDAYDAIGRIIGTCPLRHTDVDVAISGRFSRVTLRQEFTNPHPDRIEAVYTFPLSHRAAVDRMQMTIGDRVIVGEVHEREAARRTYEAARKQGYVAGLLEQERPNIFTQSVANIEPGVAVIVEISYVEMVEVVDGVHRFNFPMVVAPRYVPGSPAVSRALVPAELTPRYGIILRGPARFTIGDGGDSPVRGAIPPGRLDALMSAAQPIEFPGVLWWGPADDDDTTRAAQPAIWAPFTAEYTDGSREAGVIYTDGTGQVNGRFFYTDPSFARSMGSGFSPDTDQVPDASRVTPSPVRPPRRAGHDIALSVSLDTGGPAISEYRSELHAVTEVRGRGVAAHGNRLSLALADRREIPNRDFILEWRVADEAIEESHFAYVRPDRDRDRDSAMAAESANATATADRNDGDAAEAVDGFFTLVLDPPARVDDAEVRSRELIFVLDCSGSMEGFPIEKAKAVLERALASMRPGDIFNVVTFNNSSEVLWEHPRANTDENRAVAQAHLAARQGGGGTEMKSAVLAALHSSPVDVTALDPAALAGRPASGQRVEVAAPLRSLVAAPDESMRLRVREDLAIALDLRVALPSVLRPETAVLLLSGYWRTVNGERVFVVDAAEPTHDGERSRARFVLFLSDGEVANDDAVIEAVRSEAGRSRMFTVAIGSSPNRSLLDGMAKAGRGVADYITLEGDPDAAVQRFVDRIERPVLTDIELEFSDGLTVANCIPPVDAVPDLFDERPLVIHGRYARAGAGTLTIRGNTAHGRYERVVPVTFASDAAEHDVIATLWARAQVDELGRTDDSTATERIIALGEEFQLMTKHTSFVAVEKSRLTVGGKPMLVAIPIEMPEGQAWGGTFGGPEDDAYIQALADDLAESQRWRSATKGPAPRSLRKLSDALDAALPSSGEVGPAGQAFGFNRARMTLRSASAGDQDQIVAEIAERLDRVSELKDAGRVEEALAVNDEILFFDERNGEAVKLQDELEVLRRGVRGAAGARDLKKDQVVVLGGQFRKQATATARSQDPTAGYENAHTRFSAMGAAGGEQPVFAGVAVQPADAAGRSLWSAATPDVNAYGLAPAQTGKGFVGTIVADADQSGALHDGLYFDGQDASFHFHDIDGVPARAPVVLQQEFAPISVTGTSLDALGSAATAPETPVDVALGQEMQDKTLAISDLEREIQESTLEANVTSLQAAADRRNLLDARVQESAAVESQSTAVVPVLARIPVVEEFFRRNQVASTDAPFDGTAVPARPTLLGEEAILIIAALVERGSREDARVLADSLAAGRPDFALGVTVRDVLADESVTEDERRGAITAAGDEAEKRIATFIAGKRREARARRVLDHRFWPFAFGAGGPDELVEFYNGPTPPGATWRGGGVVITVLVRESNDETLKMLEAAGLVIEDRSKSVPIVVGIAPLGRLIDIAVVDGVRRVEPARVTAAR